MLSSILFLALACWSSKTCSLTKHSKKTLKKYADKLHQRNAWKCDGFLQPNCEDLDEWLDNNYQDLDDNLLTWSPYFWTITGVRMQNEHKKDKRDQDVKRYLKCQGSPDNCDFPTDCSYPPCNTCMYDPWDEDVHPFCKNKPVTISFQLP